MTKKMKPRAQGKPAIVFFVRGSLPTVEYMHSNERSALRRVDALCELHSCRYERNEESNRVVFTVNASAFYGRRKS